MYRYVSVVLTNCLKFSLICVLYTTFIRPTVRVTIFIHMSLYLNYTQGKLLLKRLRGGISAFFCVCSDA